MVVVVLLTKVCKSESNKFKVEDGFDESRLDKIKFEMLGNDPSGGMDKQWEMGKTSKGKLFLQK